MSARSPLPRILAAAFCLPVLAPISLARAVPLGNKAHVTQFTVHSKWADGEKDHNGPVAISVKVAYRDDAGQPQSATVAYTLKKGDTPTQMAEGLRDALKEELPESVEVKSDGSQVTARGVDLEDPSGTPDDPTKSPSPPPDPELGSKPWVSSRSYDQSTPPPGH
jgi:hypothetical protein